ncbi:hypothetical protein B0H13DRAFT_2391528 [Mycena leptocephala]|nr:hypothetical protein B0H13DRAFT_2391528 [Mycena leptocephala]
MDHQRQLPLLHPKWTHSEWNTQLHSSRCAGFRGTAPVSLGNVDAAQVHGFTKGPVWYNPKEHWLGWVPNSAASALFERIDEDVIGFLFDDDPVETADQHADVYGYSSEDEHDVPREMYAGCYLDELWANTASEMAKRLHSVAITLASRTEFYARGPTGEMGPVPAALDSEILFQLQTSEEGAQAAVTDAKRAILSALGFIAWFLSVRALSTTKLSVEDQEFVKSLRLDERRKTGVLLLLSRDYHYINLTHLINHGVVAHYAWRQQEREDRRFLRLSPEYWNEYATLKESAQGEEIFIESFPSYANWKDDLESWDWYFQNLRAGKRGEDLSTFKPEWDYYIVDFHLYGARSIKHWNTIRAYSERFKGTVAETQTGTICTFFFRQNPKGVDEPLSNRPSQEHAHELSEFAKEEVGEAIPESEIFYEATTLVREQVKVLYAPQSGKTFNSFNGRMDPPIRRSNPSSKNSHSSSGRESRASGPRSATRSGNSGRSVPLLSRLSSGRPEERGRLMSPTGRSAEASDVGIVSRWARSMAEGPRRQSSRSLSPRDNRGTVGRRSRSLSSTRTMDTSGRKSFQDEYQQNVQENDQMEVERAPVEEERSSSMIITSPPSGYRSTPLGNVPSPVQTWEPNFLSRREAIEAIEDWAPAITDFEPRIAPYEALRWNARWLNKAILVCKDERSLIRLKTYAALFQSLTKFEDVLEMGIRFGIPFQLFIPLNEALQFSKEVTSLVESTLTAMYTPGYVDAPMTWSAGSAEAQYEVYKVRLLGLLSRPHAAAFIPMGGVARYVAELYESDLVSRYAEGPSIQVSKYQKGQMMLVERDGKEVAYTTDQVSHSEVSTLLGRIPGSQPAADSTLWPPQELLESDSAHMRGYISTGAYDLLMYLSHAIVREERYVWCTRAEWKSFLHSGSKGKYAPLTVPSKSDFEEGKKLLKRSFPVSWLNAEVANISLPETFDPLSHRN